MKYSVTIVISLFLFFQADSQQLTFADWDTDQDGVIEMFEFNKVFIQHFFNNWDQSDTRGIVEKGFFDRSYAGLDTDRDSMLSDEEWMVGYHYFYDKHLKPEASKTIDKDQDGLIEFGEYYDAVYNTDYFADIDRNEDQYISEYELSTFVFNNWDMNNDRKISLKEYSKFDYYYQDF